eukprot:TRINITY_DN21209_c0_g1_i1.p1 TRINITY_DN21209_c0_g1~~TRINITY_DN21209_c0_g1_i1.p1  ORF type:complete len:477 (+),score=60.21 TRINITY_DN21209_c0_g1_i1:96-1526(+)
MVSADIDKLGYTKTPLGDPEGAMAYEEDSLIGSSSDPRRWFVLVIFMYQQAFNIMLWITYAAIAIETSLYYEISVDAVNMLSQLVLVFFLPGLLWCSYYTEMHGLRKVMLDMGWLHAAAAALRCLSLLTAHAGTTGCSLALLSIAQILSAFAQPFLMNPVRIASDWFPLHERDLAVTVGVGGFAGGSVIGMVLPTVFVCKVDGAIVGFPTLYFVNLAICAVGLALTWLAFADEPELPPSRSAAQQRQLRKQLLASPRSLSETAAGIWAEYRELLVNRDMLILLNNFGIGLGAFNSVLTVLEELIKPAGYTADDAGLFSATLFLGGSVAAIAFGLLMSCTHAYLALWRILCVGNLVSLTFIFVCLRPDHYLLMYLSSAVLGMTVLPTLPVTLACAAEVTFPVPDQASSGLLMFAGNILGALFIPAYGYLIPLAPKYNGVWTPAAVFTIAGQVLSVLMMFFYTGDSRRQRAESAEIME